MPWSRATATGDDLKALVKAAHEHGIAVLLDVVYNHLGPSDLDLWQFDGWSEHGKGGIYFYEDDRSATPWGETRPDYGRPEVRAFLRDNAMPVAGRVPHRRAALGRDRATSRPSPVAAATPPMRSRTAGALMAAINRETAERFPGRLHRSRRTCGATPP